MTRQQRRRRREAIRSGILCAVILVIALSADSLAAPRSTRTATALDKPIQVRAAKPPVTPPETPDWYRPDVPLDRDLQAALNAACSAQDVPVALALGLVEVESRFDADAVSPSGCYGLCQLNPRYFPSDLAPADNLAAGVAYLGDLLRRYDDVEKALVAYNQGAYKGTVTRYATAVLEAAERWKTTLKEETV